MKQFWIFTIILSIFLLNSISIAQEDIIEEAREVVTIASEPSSQWDGPTEGPEAQANKFIVFIGSDLLNGGVLQVSLGVEEAALEIGWDLVILDGFGTRDGIEMAFEDAFSFLPDGIIIAVDSRDYAEQLNTAAELNIPVVGWHVAAEAGPVLDPPVFTNITTDPLEVSRVAAMYAIADSDGTANVIIFTDSNFEIAIAKSDEMALVIERCDSCEVLEIVDLALSETPQQMGNTIQRLWETYGDTWNYSLGINDLYFDFSGTAFEDLGLGVEDAPINISAGDGSESAFDRIREGDYQVATVPEPLNLQGWQLIDELNRAIAGEEHSGYIAPVPLILPSNIEISTNERNIYDPTNGYQDIYRTIWGVEVED